MNQPKAQPKEITIFLASPSSDTLEARQVVVDVVHAINTDPGYEKKVFLKLLRWDDPDRTVALSAETNGQVDVIQQVGHPAKCDLLVGLFKHRMGGQLPLARFPRPPHREPWYCTEWEVDQALQGLANKTVRKVWRFRDLLDFPARKAGLTNQEWIEKFEAQHTALSNYFEKLNPTPNIVEFSTNHHTGIEQLRTGFNSMLRAWVIRELGDDHHTGAWKIEEAQPLNTDPLTAHQQQLHLQLTENPERAAAQEHKNLAALVSQAAVTGWRSLLLKQYAAWCSGSGGQLDRRFVNLTLMIDRQPQHVGERFEVDVSQRPDGRYDNLAELLAAQPDAGAWLLVGDPGCGKSTVLQHHQLSTARAALRAIAQGQTPTELCFWVRLSDYSADDAPPAEWLAQRWALAASARTSAHTKGSVLPSWAEACQRLPLRVLADGTNEIKAPNAEAQNEAMQRWAIWAAGLASSGAGHLPPLFSVRTLEQGGGLAAPGLNLRFVSMGLWTNTQMQQYCEARNAGAVWAAMQTPQRQSLLELCRLPFNLAAQCELFESTGQLATDRAELLSGVVWLRIIHEHNKQGHGALAANGLLAAKDVARIANGTWRSAMRALPEQGWLVRGLDAHAEQLHHGGREVSFSAAQAEQAFKATGSTCDSTAWLQAAQALDFIGVSGINSLTGEANLRYTHQLWQEFFAGRGLRERVPAQGAGADAFAALPNFAPPEIPTIEDAITKLGTADPLPGPGVSLWEEPVKLAVQLSSRPLDWLHHLQAVNLPLAGRAAAAALVRLNAEPLAAPMLTALRQALLNRGQTHDDLRLRIEAAEALGDLGDDLRYLKARGREKVDYLIPKPEHWVRVEAGTYRIGEGGEYSNEMPVTPVELQAFDIAFAPVTNAEYSCFLGAKGFEDDRWWVGELANTWRREGLRNGAEIERVGQLFLEARFDLPSLLERSSHAPKTYLDRLRASAKRTEEESASLLESWYGAKVPDGLPQDWANSRFNHPAQPVVGICIFEAQAYCRWLSAQTGKPLGLPTEAQWEAAARGLEARQWPWQDLSNAAAMPPINADPAHLRRTNPVGVFASADTEYGLTDMSGNVWEWTLSEYSKVGLNAKLLHREALNNSALRAVRGGSWDDRRSLCRPGFRFSISPEVRYFNLGFRVVCCPIDDEN
jgi:formylglycine-generating enzyme required for sulfatase activity